MDPTHTIRSAAGSTLARLASIPSLDPPDTWPGDSTGTDMDSMVSPMSFWRIAAVPFGTWVAALERWQINGHDGELRLGQSLLRGPVERDRHLGTCRIDVRLGRGRLRPPVRMRLDMDRWSATSTALQLIPCQRVRPSAAYFRAGRHLLNSLTQALAKPAAVQAQPPGNNRASGAIAGPLRSQLHEQAAMNAFAELHRTGGPRAGLFPARRSQGMG